MASYLLAVLLATTTQLAALLGPMLALAALMHVVAGAVERGATRMAGPRPYWLVAGWLGTAVHEAGHALFALLFGHRIDRITWFDGDATDGTRGSVEHRYDRRSVWQRAGLLFIGLGPILLGTALIAGATRLVLGPAPFAALPTMALSPIELPTATAGGPDAAIALLAHTARGVRALALATWGAARFGAWPTWAWAYCVFTVGSAIRLSGSDLRAVAAGLWMVALACLLGNALTLWAGPHATALALRASVALSVCWSAMLAGIVLNAVVGGLVVAALALTRAAGRPRRAA